jgi:electron transport complex protein RnfB
MTRAAVALIDEPRCIGCTRCIAACPVDAISGAQGLMHCVIAAWCTGCELCLPACPVDCIAMVAPPAPWTPQDERAAGRRARLRKMRTRFGIPGTTTPAQRRKVVAEVLRRKAR